MKPLLLVALLASAASAEITVVTAPKASPRELYAAERLRAALQAARPPAPVRARIVLAVRSTPNMPAGKAEAFHLYRQGNDWHIAGSDSSGVLYGALELASLIQAARALPENADYADAPAFVLRGPNIGMQKTEIAYDGVMYDHRYTQEDFPFFYDKAHWTRYLDFLLAHRMNTLYLWNGHPFTSLLKLPKYPEAQELSNEQLDKNIEMFRWLTAEAGRRGIWVVQFFYNIHLSHAFARSHGIAFQHSAPTPLVSEYTRYCISEFIRAYPNAGLLMTLGEALAPRHGPEWLAKTIIPGVKDGMRALGTNREPPIIVRAHATDIENAMKQALPLYSNIFMMHKWNGESLTWTGVRGEVRRLHESLVKLRSCYRLGIRGLHLYPLRYWEWPVTAENPPQLQIDRDWIWYATWARYAWNPERDPAAERQYWIAQLAAKYGTREAGAQILDAYQLSGVCAPRLLPRIGITEGNRQSLTLGMLMTQLINPARYNEFRLLWLGGAPPGERLNEWVRKEWERQPHEGETPLQVAGEVVDSAARAVAAAESARPHVTRNREEFERLLLDLRMIATQMRYYRAKTRAAALVLRYGYSRDLKDLQASRPLLAESLDEYRQLVALTDKTYRQACSVHSGYRRIPFLGAPGRYTHWRDCLPEYEKELQRFDYRLGRLASGAAAGQQETTRSAYPAVGVKVLGGGEAFTVQPGEKLYLDSDARIEDVAPELRGLTGIRISHAAAVKDGVKLSLELPEPGQILAGFFRSSRRGAAAEPPLDAWDAVLLNAVSAGSHPGIAVYAHSLPAGPNNLDLGRGAFVVLGFIRRDIRLQPRVVFFGKPGEQTRVDLDWLFE